MGIGDMLRCLDSGRPLLCCRVGTIGVREIPRRILCGLRGFCLRGGRCCTGCSKSLG